MSKGFFEQGPLLIGEHVFTFALREIQGALQIYLPVDFVEDKHLVSKYSYFFSQVKSPLSIALRHQECGGEERPGIVADYFRQGGEGKRSDPSPGVATFESVSGGWMMSIYSMRFAVETPGGLLLGCFNSLEEDMEDWRYIIRQILKNVQVKRKPGIIRLTSASGLIF